MRKSLSYLVAALFAVSTVSAFAAKHQASEKDAKKPSAEECKKDPKMKGCEMAKKQQPPQLATEKGRTPSALFFGCRRAGAPGGARGRGCFWCLEAVFDNLQGVTSVESGYSNRGTINPTYKQICNGNTGHAEVVRVTFDPRTISFREILEVFFTIHDPTTLNRQGNDVGTQYRSAIFYHSPEQKSTAGQLIAELTAGKIFSGPIVTEVTAAPAFYVAEDYHQEYFANNGYQPYCQAVVAPKVAKFRKKFAHRLKS